MRPIVARGRRRSPPRWRQSTIRRCAMWCSTPSVNRICSPGGVALQEMKLVSGGSGLAIGLARLGAAPWRPGSAQAGMPLAGPAVVLSGSCSVMTNSRWRPIVRPPPAPST